MLEEVGLIGLVGMQPHGELFGQKVEICVPDKLIEERVNQTVRSATADGSFKIIEQAELSRMLPVHRSTAIA